MSVSFDKIPSGYRIPVVLAEFNNSRANQGLTVAPQRMLVLGQRLATGTQPADTPVLVSGAAKAEEYFGRGSVLASMFKALEGAGNRLETWAIAQDDDAGGTAATGTILAVAPGGVSGGTAHLMIAGETVNVAIPSGMTAGSVAQLINGAIAVRTDLPVTTSFAGATVTLTARNKGDVGNDIDIRVNYVPGQELPVGVSFTITPMAGGATSPNLFAARTAMAEVQYQTIVCPYNDVTNLVQINAELIERWDPLQAIEGIAYCAFRGDFTNTQAFVGGLNSQHITCMSVGTSPTPTYNWAAVVASISAASLEIDPARPLQTLTLPGILPDQPPESRFNRSERDILLHNGMATATVDNGGLVHIERLITRYLTNATGVPDISYLDVNTPVTLGFIRSAVVNRLAQRFPRHKLADDGTKFGAGQSIATPKVIRNELIGLFLQLEARGLVEGFEQFKNDIVVERNASDPNRVDIIISPDLINQLRVTAIQVQFLL